MERGSLVSGTYTHSPITVHTSDNTGKRGSHALEIEPDGSNRQTMTEEDDEAVEIQMQAPILNLLPPKATVEPAFLNLSAPKLTVESTSLNLPESKLAVESTPTDQMYLSAPKLTVEST